MSIQSFTEQLLKSLDKVFENEANVLLNEARQQSNKIGYVAGKMDGLSSASGEIKRVYSLFVKEESEKDEDEKSLY